MSEATAISIDPEVEEILRRIASDPNSTLLRVARPRRIRALLEGQDGSRAHSVGMTAAERHLMSASAHDVAQLLREACRIKLMDPPGGPLHVTPFRSARERHILWNQAELSACTDQSRASDFVSDVPTVCWNLLEQCVAAPHGPEPSVVQLAEASLRLEPSDEARIMAALELIRSGAPKAGINILTNLLAVPTSPAVAVSARGNLGMAYSFLGDRPAALAHYSEACKLGVECLDQSMNRLLFALQLGQIDEAREAAFMIDELTTGSMEPVDLYARARQVLRQRGEWVPSAESKRAIRNLDSCFGPASRRIASVFA